MTGSDSAYVVVGAGLAGAATAWELARRDHEVTLLDRSTPANARGSSHGSARIFRYAYPDAFYTALVQDARHGWDELESSSGRTLVSPTGALDFGDQRDAAGLARVLDRAGVENELLSVADAGARWPDLRFDGDVLWHPGAGVIDAGSAVATMVELAERAGAQVLTDWPVDRVEATAHGLRLVGTGDRRLNAGEVVISAGGWLPDLLPTLPLPDDFLRAFPPLQVRQEQTFHFPHRRPGEPWPSFIHKSAGFQAYGLPGGRDADHRAQKVAQYNGGRLIASAAAQNGEIDARGRDRVTRWVERACPGLVPEPDAGTTCLFTNTPTEDFVIDRAQGITIVSPCSGHGAKFAPTIGRIAADVASGSGAGPGRFALRPDRSAISTS